MKLRIRGNSIRLRLTRGELDRFAEAGEVSDRLDLGKGGHGLTYVLRAEPDLQMPRAELRDNVLSVLLPKTSALAWATSEEVGIENVEGSLPRIIVEKDFACIAPRRGEDESDMFPNPVGMECATAKP